MGADMLAKVTARRFCRRCLAEKPLAEFRRRSKRGELRQHVCTECHRAEEKLRRARQRDADERRSVQTLVSDIKSARDTRRITAMVEAAAEKFGGPDEFAQSWKRHLDAARSLPNGHRRVCDLLCSIVRLSIAVNELQPKPDYDSMSDEELDQEIQELEQRSLVEQLPEIFESLRQVGWRIEPPDIDREFEESHEVDTITE